MNNIKPVGKKHKYNINLIYFLVPFLIILGKFIRYTLMKTVLVDTGAGHIWLNSILYGNNKWAFFESISELGNSDNEVIGNALVIYRTLNIFGFTTYEQFEMGITILFSFVIFFILLKSQKILYTQQFIFICISIIILSIFCLTLSKEPIQMAYFILTYAVIINPKTNGFIKNMLVVAILLLISVTFRRYYMLTAVFYVFSQITIKLLVNRKKSQNMIAIALFFIAMLAIYFILLNIAASVMPDAYAELIRVRTRSGTANTDIVGFFNSDNNILFIIDYALVTLRLLFPVELLPLGIKYYPYVFYQLMITYSIIKGIKNIKNNSQEKNLALYLYIGFLFSSSAFEPDFGSWIRHEAVLFPIYLVIVDAVKIKPEIEGEGYAISNRRKIKGYIN